MMTNEEFRLFRNLIYAASGISLKESRMEFLENRVLVRMKATGMSGFYWYYKLLSEKGNRELLILLDILTIHETSFFRNRPQMDFLREKALPELMKRERSFGKLRIWSAGCSTGEEPYSIAMVVLESLGRAGGDVKIFASDLSLTALDKARKGEYEKGKVKETTDRYFIEKYFEDGGGSYRVRDDVRKMVVFDFHNLKNDNGLGNLDVIFCRNVMIYFDEEEQKRLVGKFYRSLNPGGYLLLGHAESLYGLDQRFEFVCGNNGAAYRRPRKEEI